MPVAVQSSASTAWGSANNVVVTKPTGLVVGDLLVGFVAYQDGGIIITPPAGWTQIRVTTDGNVGLASFYIIATSTEVAATNFTFTANSSIIICGALARVDGFSTGNPIWASAGATTGNTATPSLANTITPAVADSLLFIALACQEGTGTVSGYAIVTSNPSWTELVDITTTLGVDYTFALAWATRTQTTATGNSSATFTGPATADWSGQQIAIPVQKSSSTIDTITETDSFFGNLISTISDSITATDTGTFLENIVWNRVTKTITSWIFPSKS